MDNDLVISAPATGSVKVTLDRDPAKEHQAAPITIFEKEGTAYTESAEACDFFSDYLGKKVLLKRSVLPRPVNPKYLVEGASSTSRNADGFPFLLASAASLELLSTQANHTIPMNRFRPNIVIGGDKLQPYVEDYWREIVIGNMTAFIVKACSRCPIPDVNQDTGKRDDQRIVKQVLEATRLGTFRDKEKLETFFGQNLVHIAEPGSRLSVGDDVLPIIPAWRRNFDQY